MRQRLVMPAPAGPSARRNHLPVGSCGVSDLLKAIVLGTIQGLTEFLPISSSAHLRIFPELFGWGDPGAAFTAVIQIGTELAVLIYFRHDIWRIGKAWLLSLFKPEWRGQFDARMGWFIIIGSLPIVVLGVLLKDVIEEDFRNLWIVGTTLVVMGIVLGLADRLQQRRPRDQADHPQGRRADGRRPGHGAHPRRLPQRRDDLDGPGARLRARGRHALRLPARHPGRRRSGALRAQGDPRRRQLLRLGPDPRRHGGVASSSGTPPSPGCCATSRRTPTRRSSSTASLLGTATLILLATGVLSA